MSKRLFYILVTVLLIIIGFSCFMIFSEVSKSEQEKEDFENLSEIVAKPIEPEPEQKEPKEEEAIHTRNLLPLYEQNSDLIGWVCIPGTNVDYPVVHTPYEPQKYLRMNFEGEYAMSGVPFLEGTRELSDGHIIIYGHNMKNKTMFSDLTKYTDKVYFDEHGTFEFETLDGLKVYNIFAVAMLKSNDAWYYFNYSESEEIFADAVEYIKEKSLYETGTETPFGKQILTLSTCYGDSDDDRIIVVGIEQ